MNIIETLKQDSTQASIRIASSQVMKAVRTGLAAAPRNKGADESVVVGMLAFLETDIGMGLMSVLLGHLLPHAPMIGTDPRVEMISKEFRIAGMANTGNAVIGEIIQFILPGVIEAMKNMPDLPKARLDNQEPIDVEVVKTATKTV